MKKIILIIFIFNSYSVYSQHESRKDSLAFLDSIYSEMDEILDQMFPRKNHFTAAVGAGTGFFNFRNISNESFHTEKKLMFSPSAGFFHKTGFGISGTGYAVMEEKLNFYQASVTPSFDYIKRGKFSTGISFTKYITKKDLSFYTTPIFNEFAAYFSYKKPIIQPAISIAYGWGTRTQYENKKIDIFRMRKARDPRQITISNEETVRDLSLLLSLRHDFYFTSIFTNHDLITITPFGAISASTQNFGLNTSFTSNSKQINNFLPGNQYISDKTGFHTQSLTGVFRADYSIKNFYIQSQFLLDYYLHSTPNRLNNAFALIAGVIF